MLYITYKSPMVGEDYVCLILINVNSVESSTPLFYLLLTLIVIVCFFFLSPLYLFQEIEKKTRLLLKITLIGLKT